jgi:CspA family cold shock protein
VIVMSPPRRFQCWLAAIRPGANKQESRALLRERRDLPLGHSVVCDNDRREQGFGMADWIDEVVAGFSADLPAGYELRRGDDEAEGSGLNLYVEGASQGGPVSQSPVDATSVAWILQELQGELIEHDFGVAWPRCPAHGAHPLRPESDGWHCRTRARSEPVKSAGAQDRWDYGGLTGIPIPPEPRRDDGEVRFYLDELGWGVIAHHDEDLWVHHAEIDMPGYRTLIEGQRVRFEIETAKQGRFRGRAIHVRPIN